MKYFAFVDLPGEKAHRHTIGVEAVPGYVDSQGRAVGARYDELIPNQEGIIRLDENHENHVKRLDRVEQTQEKLKRRCGGQEMLVGPFDSTSEALKAKYEARPKTEREQLETERADRRRLEKDRDSLRARLEKLEAQKAKPKAKAKSAAFPSLED